MAKQQAPPTGKPVNKAGKAKPGAVATATPPRRMVTGKASANSSATRVKQRTARDVSKGMQTRRPGIPPGDFTLKTDVVNDLSIVRPLYDKGSLIFRPLPCWDIDVWNSEGVLQLAPYRVSSETGAFTDWVRSYNAVSYLGAGNEAVTFLLHDPAAPDAELEWQSNPYRILWNAVYQAVEKTFAHPEWAPLIKRGESRSSIMSKPCRIYFMQGIVFKRGNEVYLNKGGPPRGLGAKHAKQIIQLKNTAGSEIIELLDQVKPNYEGDMSDYANSMVCGDPIDVHSGRFFTIFNPKDEQIQSEELANVTGYSLDGDSVRGEGSGEEERGGYRAQIDPNLVINGTKLKVTAALANEAVDRVLDQVVWWDDIINLPSVDHQCVMIARALKGYRSMLEFAWADHQEFLSTEVKQILSNARQVAVPGSAAEARTSATVEEDYYGEVEEASEVEDEEELDETAEAAEGEEGYEEYADPTDEAEGEEEGDEEVEETEEGDDAVEYEDPEDAETSEEEEYGEYEGDGDEDEDAEGDEGEEDDDSEEAAQEETPFEEDEASLKAFAAAKLRAAQRRAAPSATASPPKRVAPPAAKQAPAAGKTGKPVRKPTAAKQEAAADAPPRPKASGTPATAKTRKKTQ